MARIRTIKPGFFQNEELAGLPYEWRLLFIGLWTEADRDGRLEDRPLRLKATLFPYDDLNIDQGLGCLVNAGLITRYERGELRLVSIKTWAKHQRPNDREAQSQYPPPDTAGTLLDLPGTTGREGKGTGMEGVPAGAVLERFDTFWAEYPRKVSKDAARKVWLKLAPDASLLARMLSAVRAQKHSAQWIKNSGEFVPHARTWIAQKRWEDESQAARPRGGLGLSTEAPWICPHVDRCGSPGYCAQLLGIDAERMATGGARKWALKPDVRFELDAHGVPREVEPVS